jgi:cation:H+ antiporter
LQAIAPVISEDKDSFIGLKPKGPYAPWLFLALFLAASFLMIWRLEAMSAKGFEGTVLGTLVMPYCSGMGNLIFAFILGRNGGSGADVMTNSLVNNVTNMTLVLGLPAIIWGMNVIAVKKKPEAGKKKKPRPGGSAAELNRLSLLLTLTAVLFFTGAVWAMGRKGRLISTTGWCWSDCFCSGNAFTCLKCSSKTCGRANRFWLDAAGGSGAARGRRVWHLRQHRLARRVDFHIHTGFISAKHLGWLSGWLMVLPNALLAFYYSWRKKPEVVYASQVGDAHVSIPLCLGIYALYHTMVDAAVFPHGHVDPARRDAGAFFFVAVFGQLPRIAGWALVAAYGWFLWKGLLG